jgi:hypothetical protein
MKGVRHWRTHRAGPTLPSYLALHHAGFSVPRLLPNERWALTPPFHPYRGISFRRRLAGFPVRCHRAPFHRRFIFCGTFREPHRTHDVRYDSPGVTRRVAFTPRLAARAEGHPLMTQSGVRTFLPFTLRRRRSRRVTSIPKRSRQTSDHPAHPLV